MGCAIELATDCNKQAWRYGLAAVVVDIDAQEVADVGRGHWT